jgi:putative hemolysin
LQQLLRALKSYSPDFLLLLNVSENMEFIVILLLILLNGVFAMYEIALISSRRTRLEEKADAGSRGAKTALDLLDNPQEFLSTIQIGITLIGIISGAYAGVEIADDLTPYIASVPMFSSAAAFISIAIVVFAVTYFSIVLGELVPKSIALEHPEKITIALTSFMKGLATIGFPLVWFLSFSTRGILRLFKLKPNPVPPITEEELKLMLRQGSEYGVIEKHESEMITEMFRFGAKTAFSIMTPKIDIRWMDLHDTREKVLGIISDKGYSKYPVCDGSLDKIVGIVAVKDILPLLNTEPFDLTPILSDPLFVPESQPASAILERFREKKIHIAIVVDEYGGTEGLITLHDLIEHILGDLPDLLDKEPPDYQKKEDGSYVINGSMNFWEFAELLELPEMDDEEFEEEARHYSTVGGLAMVILNTIPQTGDTFTFKEHQFRILEMEGNRVAKMSVRPAPEKLPG